MDTSCLQTLIFNYCLFWFRLGRHSQTRKSTRSYCTFCGTNRILWFAKKQPTILLCSTEVEYRAMVVTTAKITWLSFLLIDLHVHHFVSPISKCDNLNASQIIVNLVFHAQSKHNEIVYHYVREQIVLDKL